MSPTDHGEFLDIDGRGDGGIPRSTRTISLACAVGIAKSCLTRRPHVASRIAVWSARFFLYYPVIHRTWGYAAFSPLAPSDPSA